MATRTQHPKPRKIKIGTILDEEVLQRLKERSAKEGRPINALIEDAIRKYEHEETMARELRLRALESVFALRFNISDEDFRNIMEEDYYEQ
ncbi:MAG: ribbon-helix-helix protein, CopG family [Bacteroidota bacterium]